jgi:hypothetical protein
MPTKNIVPRTGSEGKIGTTTKRWSEGNFDTIDVSGSTRFGNELTHTHIFTGSFHQTGSGATSFFKDTIDVTGNLTASGHVSASAFFGDGSNLSGISTATPTLDQVTTAGNTTTNNISVTDLTVTEITASGIISSSAQAYIPKINLNDDFSANYISYNNGFFFKGNGHFYGNLTSSVFSASSGFVGDGSGLTGVTGDWDGQHTGDAGITGSLTLTGSSPNMPQLHIINSSGSHLQPDFNTGFSSFTGFSQEFVPGTGMGIMGASVKSEGSSGERAYLSTLVDVNGVAGERAQTTLYVSGTSGASLGEASFILDTNGNIDARSMLADYYRFTTTDISNGVYVGLGSSATTGSVTVGYPGVAGETRMTFKTSNNATGETDRMTLDHDGNFGIGTTTPAHKLDVVGSAAVTGSLDIKSDTGLVMIGADGTSSGSLFHSGGGLILGGEPNDVGILAPGAQAFMSNGNAFLNVNGTDVNLTPHSSGKVAVAGILSASLGITASSFVGDGSGLTNVPATETDTLATVTARGASTTTPVLFNTHITASTGISSGPLHVVGSSVHSGTIDMYSGGGLYLYGENATPSGSFLSQASGGTTLGNTTADVGLLSYGGQAFVGSGPTSLVVNSTDITLTPHSSGKVTVAGVLSASLGITASSFVGDGSGLTNLPASSWDGQLNGDAGITGSLDVSGSTDFGNLSTDTHQISGSLHFTNPGETNAGIDITGHGSNQVSIKQKDTANGRINIGAGLNSTIRIDSNFAGSTYPAAGTDYYWGSSTKPWGHIGTKRLSASLGAHFSDTTAPGTPTAAAQLYAKSGALYTKNDDGIESLIEQRLIAMSKVETVDDTAVACDIKLFSDTTSGEMEALQWTIDSATRYAKVTFTAPANGQAKVCMSTFLKDAGGTSEVWFGLHNSSTSTTTPTYGWFQISKDSEAGEHDLESVDWVLTGLTAGASITVYVHAVCSLAGSQVKVGRPSPNAWSNNDLPKPTTISVYTVPVTIDVNPT